MIKSWILSVGKSSHHETIKRTSQLWSLFFILVLLGAGLNACSSDDPIDSVEPPPAKDGLEIKRVSIPSSLNLVIGEEVTISGQGFESGDKIRLALLSDPNEKHLISTSTVTDEKAAFSLPEGVVTGRYSVTVVRDNKSQFLGSITLNVVTDTDIPDKEGMTVKGVVSSDGEGVEGVVVSDGYEVTTTDADGIYYLPSAKKNRYVFISVPGNYEVNNSKNLPVFYQRLAGGTGVEVKNFSLIKTDNSNHVVLAMADWHLAARNSDVTQFTTGMLPDINNTIAEYQAKGTKVYGLTLGDLSWDLYWYSNRFALPEYLEQMYKVNSTIFNVIGNHDNDPYASNDWDGALPFKENVAPNYYSFNLGDVHYVVLDNIEWINSGGSQGNVGARNYNATIVADQMAWLRKDLATIKDKSTPIVIAMHIPLYNYPALNADGSQRDGVRLTNGNQLISLLNDFTDVRVLTGHTHCNFTVQDSPNIMEYNIAAISATWWWTGRPGYAGNHICKDGSPGGYGVFEMEGKDMKYYYKSMGYEKDYQFRTYDLNNVHITAEKFAPKSTNAKMAPYTSVYASPNSSNEVLINVWGYDEKWEIEVKEDGRSLDVQRVIMKDPLHIISYEAQRLNAGATPTSAFVTNTTAHLFKVKASSPTSTLYINVIDRYGNLYSEVMERPKEFSYLMR